MKRLTRAQLHSVIWTKTLTELAESWSTRPQQLAAICDQFKIARPASGYWTQYHLGKASDPTPLDIDSFPVNLKINIPSHTEPKKPMSPESKLVVPKSTTKYEPAVRLAIAEHKLSTFGRGPLLYAQFNPKAAALTVSKETLKRAAGILNVLYKYARLQDWAACSQNLGDTIFNVFDIDGEPVRFRIREPMTRRPRELSAKDRADKAAGRWVDEGMIYTPTGRLILSLDGRGYSGRKVWEDKPSRSLEACLGEFLARIVQLAEAQAEWRTKRETNERNRVRAQAIMTQVRVRTGLWADRSKVLLSQFDQWQRAGACRRFITAVEGKMISRGPLTAGQKEWLKWAHRIADDMDPTDNIGQQDMSDWAADDPLSEALKAMTKFDRSDIADFERAHDLDWFEGLLGPT